MNDTPELLDARTLQSLFGLSRSMTYALLNRRDLPVVTIGRRRFMHKSLFESWLAEQASGRSTASTGGES